jgi:hypothetical protein
MRGFTVVPVNPDLVARRRGPARKKDDAEDARICCLLALDQHSALRTLVPHGEVAAELRAIARDDARAAVDERRLLNRLRADLIATFPAALDIAGGQLEAPTVLRRPAPPGPSATAPCLCQSGRGTEPSRLIPPSRRRPADSYCRGVSPDARYTCAADGHRFGEPNAPAYCAARTTPQPGALVNTAYSVLGSSAANRSSTAAICVSSWASSTMSVASACRATSAPSVGNATRAAATRRPAVVRDTVTPRWAANRRNRSPQTSQPGRFGELGGDQSAGPRGPAGAGGPDEVPLRAVTHDPDGANQHQRRR